MPRHLGEPAETLRRLVAYWVDLGVLAGARRDWIVRNTEFLEALTRSVRRSF
jgi:hypothetical protein